MNIYAAVILSLSLFYCQLSVIINAKFQPNHNHNPVNADL